MAKIVEEVVLIKLSKLVKENTESGDLIATNEVCDALEQVAQELAGGGVVVEVVRA
jgi:hypothetical protein